MHACGFQAALCFVSLVSASPVTNKWNKDLCNMGMRTSADPVSMQSLTTHGPCLCRQPCGT